MAVRRAKTFCVMFERTPSEKRAAALSKEMDSTKAELAETKAALSELMKVVEQLKSGK